MKTLTGVVLTCLTLPLLQWISPALSQTVEPAPSEEVLKPLGKVNPNQPVKVVLINATTFKIEYGLTTGRTRSLDAGKQVTHDRISLPANGVFYPVASITDPLKQPAFNVDLSVSGNVVTVKVRQIESGAEGDSVVQIRRSGSVFVY